MYSAMREATSRPGAVCANVARCGFLECMMRRFDGERQPGEAIRRLKSENVSCACFVHREILCWLEFFCNVQAEGRALKTIHGIILVKAQEVHRQIPPRDGHPCRPANGSPCRVRRGLPPPSERALPGAPIKNRPRVAASGG